MTAPEPFPSFKHLLDKVKKTHKHKFYPTGENRFVNAICDNLEKLSCEHRVFLKYPPKVKEYKFICECGETKWVKEK